MKLRPLLRAGLTASHLAAVAPALADGMPADRADGRDGGSDGGTPVGDATPASFKSGPNDQMVTPGRMAAFAVALGHTNRVVTPFADFDVWSASGETFQTRQNVFYIAPTSTEPITLFVTPKDDERLALHLMLSPADIPPAEIHLKLVDAAGALILPAALGIGAEPSGVALPPPADPSFASAPHESAIADLLRAVVAGDVPPGYGAASMNAVHPRCRLIGGVTTSFAHGQRFVGSAYEVFVGVARNGAAAGATFLEEWCAGPDVAAVALWPTVHLAPGAASEIFVVRRRAAAPTTPPERVRPSLLRHAVAGRP
jgi:conjugal transfer pilus assembly protein TraK